MKLFNFFKKKEVASEVIQPVEETKPKTVRKKISDKDKATARGESYIRVIETHIDPNNPSNGYFELDWNSFFIDELKKAGYTGNTEEEIIDKWFRNLCQSIISESNPNQEVRLT